MANVSKFTNTKQPNGSRLVVPKGAKLIKDEYGGNYTSEDYRFEVQFNRYGDRKWTVMWAGGNEDECDTLREAQEWVADDETYEAANE